MRASAGILAAVVLVTAVQAASALAASASSRGSKAASTTLTSTTSLLHRRVPAAGLYKVVVRLRGSGSQRVAVYANAGAHRRVTLDGSGHARVVLQIHLTGTKLNLRIVSSGGRVHVKVSAAPVTPAVVAPVTPAPAVATPAAAPAATSAAAPVATPAAASEPEYLGPYTHLVWSDDFQGPAGAAPSSSNWTAQSTGGCGGGTLSSNTQSTANAHLDGQGNLDITAIASGGGNYSSAQLSTAGHFQFRFGAVEARIWLPAGTGLCSAFWMNGQSSGSSCWPWCGEMDILEALGQTTNAAYGTLHGPISGTSNTQQVQDAFKSPVALTSGYHTYGVVWQPGRITWAVDGVAYGSVTLSSLQAGSQWVFDSYDESIILDLAVGGWPGPPTAATSFPATMKVSWVRVYQ